VGLVGAASVAAFILILDTVAGYPLGTPSALGVTVFRGEAFDLSAPINAGAVLGYTLLHVAVFVAIGALAVSTEYTLSRSGAPIGRQFLLGITGLFVALQGTFGTLVLLLGIPWVGDLGFERILVGNAIAAFSMALSVYLRGVDRRSGRSDA